MDNKAFDKMGKEGLVPSLLIEKWKQRHWCHPLVAAREGLLIDMFFRRMGFSAVIGGVVFLFLSALFLFTAPLWWGKPDTTIIFLSIAVAPTWILAHLAVNIMAMHTFEFGTVHWHLCEEARQFSKHFSDLQHAAGKPFSELAKMDLKVLAEELLVARAKQVLLAEEGLGVGRGEFLDTTLAHEKIKHVDAFKSLYSTMKELGLATDGFARYYTQARELRKQEKRATTLKKEFGAAIVAAAGVSSPLV